MSVELLYTSAPQGLKQGSRGFCTVISTAGMPINLAQRLESLSSYRQLYPPQDAKAADNPICYSHLRLKLGGRTVSILSRITAHGVDYSQRTNKLAHHVVLDQHEQPTGGPSNVLSQPGLMRTDWNGKCETPHAGPAIATPDVVARVCATWACVTGDAGWAGVVADAWLQPTIKPVWIIFTERQSEKLLTLLEEAVALLPTNRRWIATFTTYYTNLPPDIDCRVRCVLHGTDEARMAIARGVVIDLTKPMPLALASPAVIAARKGESIGSIRPPSLPDEVEPIPVFPESVLATSSNQQPVSESLYPGRNSDDETELQLASLQSVPPRHKLFREISSKRIPSIDSISSSGSRQPRVVLFVSLAVILFAAAGLGAAAYFQKQLVVLNDPQDVSNAESKPIMNEKELSDNTSSREEKPSVDSASTPAESASEYISTTEGPVLSIRVDPLEISVDENSQVNRKLAIVTRSNTELSVSVTPSNIFELKNESEIWLRKGAKLNFEKSPHHDAVISCEGCAKQHFRLKVTNIDEPPIENLEIAGAVELNSSFDLRGESTDEDAIAAKPVYVWKWSYDNATWKDIPDVKDDKLPLKSWMNGKWIGVAAKYKDGLPFVVSNKICVSKQIAFKAVGKIDFDMLCQGKVLIAVQIPAEPIEKGLFTISNEPDREKSAKKRIENREFSGLDDVSVGINQCRYLIDTNDNQDYLAFSTEFSGLRSNKNAMFVANNEASEKNRIIDFENQLRKSVQAIDPPSSSGNTIASLTPEITNAFRQKPSTQSIVEIFQSIGRCDDDRQELILKTNELQKKIDDIKNEKPNEKLKLVQVHVVKMTQLQKLDNFSNSETCVKLRSLAKTIRNLSDFRASILPGEGSEKKWLFVIKTNSLNSGRTESLTSRIEFNPYQRIDLTFEARVDIPTSLLDAAKKIVQ